MRLNFIGGTLVRIICICIFCRPSSKSSPVNFINETLQDKIDLPGASLLRKWNNGPVSQRLTPQSPNASRDRTPSPLASIASKASCGKVAKPSIFVDFFEGLTVFR